MTVLLADVAALVYFLSVFNAAGAKDMKQSDLFYCLM